MACVDDEHINLSYSVVPVRDSWKDTPRPLAC